METDHDHSYSRVAVFPLGRFEEARSFAIDNLPHGGQYTENLQVLEDCGESLCADTEVRSLVDASRMAVASFSRKYTNIHTPNEIEALLNDVPISSILTYRKLAETASQYRDTGQIDADGAAEALREAARDPLASVFSSNGLVPLEAVADLWEERPVHVLFGVSGLTR